MLNSEQHADESFPILKLISALLFKDDFQIKMLTQQEDSQRAPPFTRTNRLCLSAAYARRQRPQNFVLIIEAVWRSEICDKVNLHSD